MVCQGSGENQLRLLDEVQAQELLSSFQHFDPKGWLQRPGWSDLKVRAASRCRRLLRYWVWEAGGTQIA